MGVPVSGKSLTLTRRRPRVGVRAAAQCARRAGPRGARARVRADSISIRAIYNFVNRQSGLPVVKSKNLPSLINASLCDKIKL